MIAAKMSEGETSSLRQLRLFMNRRPQETNSEDGSIILESAIVFPIVFVVLIFIIYLGNVYYEQARVEKIVMKNAVLGAEAIADVFHNEMEQGGISADLGRNLDPYRYLFGGNQSQVENEISARVEQEIREGAIGFFNNAKANQIGTDNQNGKAAYYKTHLFCSSFVVQVNYEVKLPLQFSFMETPTLFSFSARAEVTVNDETEFIRNADMALDLLSQTKIGSKIGDLFGKVGDFIEKFTKR